MLEDDLVQALKGRKRLHEKLDLPPGWRALGAEGKGWLLLPPKMTEEEWVAQNECEFASKEENGAK